MWHDTVNLWVEIAQGVTTTLAIILGGWWAYFRFVRQREGCPRARIEHMVSFKRLSDSSTLLRVGVEIRNEGNVLLKWNEGLVRVQQVLPCPPETVAWLYERLESTETGQTEADWPLLAERAIAKHRQEIEPGEPDTTYFDFILGTPIESVLIYSHIRNATKEGVGWNHTTMHDVDMDAGELLMAKRDTRQGPPKLKPVSPLPSLPPRQPSPMPQPSPTPQGPPKQPPEPPPPPPKAK